MAIIESFIDTDLYKLTMQQAVLHLFPGAEVEYRFKCRNQKADLHSIKSDLEWQIGQLANLSLTREEEEYLRGIRFLKPDYIDFLIHFKFNPTKYVSVQRIYEPPGGLEIIIKGPWLQTILFEVPILAIINQLYYYNHRPAGSDFVKGYEVLREKIKLVKESPYRISLLEFGTRRRYSAEWQARVLNDLKRSDIGLIGTSNVDLARRFNLTPMGTMAHEFLQAGQALGPNLRNSQIFALDSWVKEYRGDLGIALTDVIGIEAFLKDFDLYFCKLYDGVRHDSGDPFIWAKKMTDHYRKMGINPITKTFVFSDGLTFPLCLKLQEQFYNNAKLLYGIGTYLTNDFGPDHERLDIIIKMVKCNGQSVAKLSDSEGKIMCQDQEYLAYLRKVFQR